MLFRCVIITLFVFLVFYILFRVRTSPEDVSACIENYAQYILLYICTTKDQQRLISARVLEWINYKNEKG